VTPRSPVEVVQAQLDAYNTRDLDAFLAQYGEDAEVLDLGSPTPTTRGKSALADRYRQLFDRSPALHCDIVNRSALGRVVIDHERITGRDGSDAPVEVMAIYEVIDGLIQRVHFVRP
jgi:hypothetical protein